MAAMGYRFVEEPVALSHAGFHSTDMLPHGGHNGAGVLPRGAVNSTEMLPRSSLNCADMLPHAGHNSTDMLHRSSMNGADMLPRGSVNSADPLARLCVNDSDMMSRASMKSGDLQYRSSINGGDMHSRASVNGGDMISRASVGDMLSRPSVNGGEMPSRASLNGGEMLFRASANGGEMLSRSSLTAGELPSRPSVNGGASTAAALAAQGAAEAAAIAASLGGFPDVKIPGGPSGGRMSTQSLGLGVPNPASTMKRTSVDRSLPMPQSCHNGGDNDAPCKPYVDPEAPPPLPKLSAHEGMSSIMMSSASTADPAGSSSITPSSNAGIGGAVATFSNAGQPERANYEASVPSTTSCPSQQHYSGLMVPPLGLGPSRQSVASNMGDGIVSMAWSAPSSGAPAECTKLPTPPSWSGNCAGYSQPSHVDPNAEMPPTLADPDPCAQGGWAALPHLTSGWCMEPVGGAQTSCWCMEPVAAAQNGFDLHQAPKENDLSDAMWCSHNPGYVVTYGAPSSPANDSLTRGRGPARGWSRGNSPRSERFAREPLMAGACVPCAWGAAGRAGHNQAADYVMAPSTSQAQLAWDMERPRRAGSVPPINFWRSAPQASWQAPPPVMGQYAPSSCAVPWPPPPLPPVPGELRERLEALEQQRGHQQNHEFELEKRFELLRNELSTAQASVERCAALESQLEQRDRELHDSRNAIQAAEAREAEMVRRSQELEKQVREDGDHRSREIIVESDRLRGELRAMQTAHDTERGLKEDAQQRHLEGTNEIARLKADLQKMQIASEAEKQAGDEARRRHQSVMSDFDSIQNDLNRLQDADRHHQRAVADLDKLQSDMQRLKEDLAAESLAREAADRRHEDALAEAEQLRIDVQQLRESRDQLQSNFTKNDSERRRSLDLTQNRVHELQQELEQERSTARRYSETLRQHQSSSQQEAQRTLELTHSYEEKMRAYDDELSHLHQQIKILQDERDQLAEDVDHLKRADSERRIAESHLRRSLEDEQKQVRVLLKEVETVKAERDLLEAKARMRSDGEEVRRSSVMANRRQAQFFEAEGETAVSYGSQEMIAVDLTGEDDGFPTE